MTRWARVGRGASVAVFATLIAAASHMLAGGNTPALMALASTVILGTPLSVALAGVRLSLPRLTVGVSLVQVLFHVCFSLVGIQSGPAISSAPALPAHAQHQQALSQLLQGTASIPNTQLTGVLPDALMLLWHAIAAVLTIALLRRGEHAMHGLCSFVWTALTALWRIPRGVPWTGFPRPVLIPILPLVFPLSRRSSRTRSVRGPPTMVHARAPRLSA